MNLYDHLFHLEREIYRAHIGVEDRYHLPVFDVEMDVLCGIVLGQMDKEDYLVQKSLDEWIREVKEEVVLHAD